MIHVDCNIHNVKEIKFHGTEESDICAYRILVITEHDNTQHSITLYSNEINSLQDIVTERRNENHE